jgi:hypothetical protein
MEKIFTGYGGESDPEDYLDWIQDDEGRILLQNEDSTIWDRPSTPSEVPDKYKITITVKVEEIK